MIRDTTTITSKIIRIRDPKSGVGTVIEKETLSRNRTVVLPVSDGIPDRLTERTGRMSEFAVEYGEIMWREEVDTHPFSGEERRAWRTYGLKVTGRRVRRDGSFGAPVSETYHLFDEKSPEWVKGFLTEYHPETGKYPFDTSQEN